MDQHHSFGVDRTPLHCSAAVIALWHAWGDRVALTNVLNAVATWGELVTLPTSHRLALIGPALAAVELPAVCPPVPDLPGDARAVTPYDMDYPRVLNPTQWPVVYMAGHVPTARAAAVTGGANPTPQGVEIARSAALAAAGDHVPVVAVVSDGLGLAALRTAVAAGATVIAVVPHSLEIASAHQGLLDQVRRSGGAVISAARPGVGVDARSETDAAVLAVALSYAVVVAEVGAPPNPAATLTRAAIEAERYLVAPAPPAHHVPTGALGLTVLTQPRMFTPDWYGTSARVRARLAAGLPAADAVVNDQAQISIAIRQSCRAAKPSTTP